MLLTDQDVIHLRWEQMDWHTLVNQLWLKWIYRLEWSTDLSVEAIKFSTESCRYVKRPWFRYVLHPATTWRSDSGSKQNEHSDVADIPLFKSFSRVGRVLFIYRIVKLKIFLGSLLWTEDHMELNESAECLMMFEKNEPCEIMFCWSLRVVF